MLEVFEPGALNYFTFFRPILSTLSAFRNPILTHLPPSGFLDSLLGVLIAPTSGLAFSLLMPRTLAAALSFSSSRAYKDVDPYSDYVGINISLNNSSSLSFLNVYAPPFARPQRMAEPILFLPPPEISSFWGTSIYITPSGTQRGTSDPHGEEVFDRVISSSITITHPPFSIAPLLTFPLPPFLFPFLAPGRCFRTLVLTTYQFFYLSLSLRSFAPTSAPLSLIFRKLAWMGLPPTSTLTVPQQRNTRPFLFPLLLLFLPLWH